jgi:hypothetical protein
MTITQDMQKIKKMAKRKGTPLLKVNFSGKMACSFVYGGSRQISYWYRNLTKAIQGELARLGK